MYEVKILTPLIDIMLHPSHKVLPSRYYPILQKGKLKRN